MTNDLMITSNFNETMQLGEVLSKSGFFQDSQSAAQAIVKILAGRELGFGPVASMTGINVIKGKVSLSANLIAAAVKRSGRYNYRVIRLDDQSCSIKFFEGGKEIGDSTFTMDDAKTAGLATDNWRKFPKNMLFARAMSNGAKWYCPDLSGGPLYTPDELGAEIDGETGEVISAPDWHEIKEVEYKQAPAQATKYPARPWDAETLRRYMTEKAAILGNGAEASPERRKAAVIALSAICGDNEDKRHAVTRYLFGNQSTKALTKGQVEAAIKWVGLDSAGLPNAHTISEVEAVAVAAGIEAGQLELLPEEVK